MDDFADVLQRDYGLKPQGKSAPMSAAKSAVPLSSSSPYSSPGSIHRTTSAGNPKNGSNRNSRSSTPILGETMQEDLFFGSLNGIKSASSTRNTFGSATSDLPVMYDDVFGGPTVFASPSHPPVTTDTMQQTTLSASSQTYDDVFRMAFKPSASSTATSASPIKGSFLPVFNAPLYDDDIFGGMPGIRNANVVYDDVFSGVSTVGTSPGVLEDLLGVSESRESRERSSSSQSAFESVIQSTTAMGDFDELLPGFGGSEPIKPRQTGDGKPAHHKSSGLGKDSHGMLPDDPFGVLQVDDPFDVLQSGNWTSDPSVPDLDALKVPAQSSGGQGRPYSNNDIDENIAVSGNTSPHDTTTQSPSHKSVNTVRYPSKKKDAGSPTVNAAQINFTVSEGNHLMRNDLSNSQAKDQTRISLSSPNLQSKGGAEASSINSPSRRNRQVYDEVENPMQRPRVVKSRQFDEFWIAVEDVKLVTQPTAAPPPSRRPPLPGSKQGRTTRKAADSKQESNQDAVPNLEDFAAWHESPGSFKLSALRGASEYSNNFGSVFDELEEFATGPSRAQKEVKKDTSATILEEEMMERSAAASASAIAMQEAMERARSKLQDREKVEREREARASRIMEDKEKASNTRESEEGRAHEIEEKERAREKEAKEREAKAIREREEREREELEKELRERHRKEREKEKEREREREREKDRIAVERATQEARERAERAAVERATAEARERAAAEARQRAAVERATAEARERAAAEARERAAVERATSEARERAAAEARERAAVERATAEARERAAAEAREKAAERASVERAASEARARAERAAVERVNAEARERAAERAASEVRERAERAAVERATAAREKQRRNENDLEAFFSSNSRPGSAPRQRSPAKGASSEGRQSSKGFSTEGLQRSSNVAPSVRKVAPTTNSADDWTSLFGAAVSTSREFQEVEGESAERQRARWERHQRTVERAAKALEEKNQRDLQSLREQAERHRAGEILDAEIKRWAAGKDGNIRALLSTLQYVLWPECGWQAVSLTDLITAAAVKKVYRKATLCVHPDKVQQKGATIQQKYIAEKVFDLLKEAWNKFNSEELF